MKNQFSHNLIQWLYQTKTVAYFYDLIVNEASSIVVSGKLKEEFINVIPEGGKILEVGSGPGNQAMKILQYRPDLKIIASDFSSEMLSLGKKKYQELILKDEHIRRVQPRLSFVQADAMDLSQFDSETFDGIYSVAAIKHFPDPIRGLHECSRILQKGGRMFFYEFFAEASLEDMINFGKHIKIPDLIKPMSCRLFHIVIKNEAPEKADLEKWNNELCSNGFTRWEYLQGYPFFSFHFDKKRNCLDMGNVIDKLK